ncbi:Asp23/Gls24 family envelope stress response protein [Rathayibacter sp. VKM Ac-2759]|uniref:Asp23/Gls24 family envelope stress response protein n=1 Tax=Rathayibacter sp. VKM Ac-2759 TaxID=2609252 RepID=UPI0013161CA5|nr:Asp23/Gls24 family envelope stress response protein [Rathayibacter sp. VKM Ac-2759]QHC68233.1 Asp23/Gls24 family envelope stress response protein [Rathayibacter sp. VKM Ac-2759]
MTDSDRTIDLGAVDRGHPEGESIERLVATAAAETAVGVSGVHHLGGTAARSLDRAARAVLGTSTSPGVTVSRADGVTTVDLDLVVEYPHRVKTVIDATREQVSRAAAPLAAGSVVVNVTVTDVHGPFDPIEVPDDEREYGEPLVDKARDAIDSAREQTADALDSAADAVGEEREADEARAAADRPAADRPVEAEAPVAAEFVVRVEVEPVDGGSAVSTPPVAVEIEPVESEPAESVSASDDATASHRAGQE